MGRSKQGRALLMAHLLRLRLPFFPSHSVAFLFPASEETFPRRLIRTPASSVPATAAAFVLPPPKTFFRSPLSAMTAVATTSSSALSDSDFERGRGPSSATTKVTFFPSREEADAAAAEAALSSSSSSSSAAAAAETETVETETAMVPRPPLVRCGDLACQHDSFLRTLGGTSLLGCALYIEDGSSSAGGGKKKKKAKKKKAGAQKREQPEKGEDGEGNGSDSAASSPLRCAVVLSDSIFFPEGGGQPADRGRISFRFEDDGKENGDDNISDTLVLDVLDGQNLGGVCVVTCRPSGPMSDTGREDLARALGRTAVSIVQEIDWPLRFDHMTQHSAQHLLSAIAASDDFGGLYTASFSLGRGAAATSYIDFKVGDDLYARDIDEIRSLLRRLEGRANESIRRNLPMTPRYLDPASEEFNEKVRSRLLPEGLSGPLRLVEIGDGIDLNTCCGTHVPSLAHLQAVQIFRVEKVKGGVVRAHFAAAERLRRIVAEMYDRQARFTSMLSCAEEEHVDRVKKMLEDKVKKEREMKSMVDRMCALQAKDLVRECKEAGGVVAVDVGSGFDMAYLMQLSRAAIEQFSYEESDGSAVLMLFVSSAAGDNGQMEDGAFLLSGDVSMVDRLGKEVANALGGRGGGKNGRFQGKGTKILAGLNEARLLLEKEMKSSQSI